MSLSGIDIDPNAMSLDSQHPTTPSAFERLGAGFFVLFLLACLLADWRILKRR
ncbi:MAG: hypothetical protein HKN14_13515 [Marinicaulis sp.]|nr:hypothetical protein [Marinicaulis sp.]NNE41924.1 hypothetical protein [Marinicaulis sp.]NNL88908.1 hypothetical protein [Marinicaulis sp.]